MSCTRPFPEQSEVLWLEEKEERPREGEKESGRERDCIVQSPLISWILFTPLFFPNGEWVRRLNPLWVLYLGGSIRQLIRTAEPGVGPSVCRTGTDKNLLAPVWRKCEPALLALWWLFFEPATNTQTHLSSPYSFNVSWQALECVPGEILEKRCQCQNDSIPPLFVHWPPDNMLLWSLRYVWLCNLWCLSALEHRCLVIGPSVTHLSK